MGAVGCGGDAANMSEQANLTDGSSPSTRTIPDAGALFSLTAADLVGITTRPETFVDVFQSQGTTATNASAVVRQKLGAQFTTLENAGCLATFATFVAFNVAPTGDNGIPPLDATLQQLMSSSALTCGHFCKLATLLSLIRYPHLIPPDSPAGAPAKPTIHFLVWLENAPLDIGLHSQLIITNVLESAYLLLDPLYGLVLRIPYSGNYPQSGATAIENAAALLQVPIDPSNLVLLDPSGTMSDPRITATMLSGQLSPTYIYHDALFGSEGWDLHIARTFLTMT